MTTSPPDRAAHRRGALLTLFLLLGLVVLGNRLARAHLDLRVDLSAERLSEPSPVARRMLGALTDMLSVRAYFTGKPRLGVVQIAKRRLVEALDGLARIGAGRVELEYLDPNESSQAREEARALGIVPVPVKGEQGTSEVSQETWFGLVLGSRGREEVLPFVLPQTFESSVLAALGRLLRESPPTVGFLTGRGDGAGSGFLEAQKLLAPDYRVRELLDLDLGQPIPADVELVVVAAPRELHPRTVFALDQFLQRGGRALFLIDRTSVDLTGGKVEPVTTGLEEALRLWGGQPGDALVYDLERSNRITTREAIQLGGETVTGGEVRIPYPFWPNVGQDGLDPTNPVTARLEGADLFWAGALPGEAPAGLERTPLLQSSANAWLVDPAAALELDPRSAQARATDLRARGGAGRRVLAVALAGRFASPFEAGAPAPRDPIQAALDRARGGEPTWLAPTAEIVQSRAAATEIVVVADADWAASEKFFTPRNQELFRGLVDWLSLEEDLLALRTRQPRARALRDFVAEERHALGLLGPRAEGLETTSAIAALEEQADGRAAARRWRAMGLVFGGSIAAALVLGLGLGRACGRRPRRPQGGPA